MIEDFWIWLPKAYGDVGDEPVFTKYNMEVAFGAGAEAEAKRMWQGLTKDEVDGWGCPVVRRSLSLPSLLKLR